MTRFLVKNTRMSIMNKFNPFTAEIKLISITIILIFCQKHYSVLFQTLINYSWAGFWGLFFHLLGCGRSFCSARGRERLYCRRCVYRRGRCWYWTDRGFSQQFSQHSRTDSPRRSHSKLPPQLLAVHWTRNYTVHYSDLFL